ncbi:hypothetical protein CL659_05030 [bacterium]|nr:hypothetical protein [bacterium]|tara:strand:+ start:6617 stop:7231 length:615 start_codon:yes stop_codon:yes gene_type:complete
MRKKFLLIFIFLFSFGFENFDSEFKKKQSVLINHFVFKESYLFDFCIGCNGDFDSLHVKKIDNNSWSLLKNFSYLDLNKSQDPRIFLPSGVPEEDIFEINELFSSMSLANDKLWEEVIYLIEFGLRNDFLFFENDGQVFLYSVPNSEEGLKLFNDVIEGIESRLYFIDSNRFHFFLDAVLLLPDSFKRDWFDRIESWQPPELPN